MSNIYDALASAIYMSKVLLNNDSVDTDDKKIRASGLYEEWIAGNHIVGEVYNTNEYAYLGEQWIQTWECFQAYDNKIYSDIVPGNQAWFTFNRPLHGTSVETARKFVPVQGAHDMYKTGEYMIYTDGKVYKCIENTNFSPEDYPRAWEEVV